MAVPDAGRAAGRWAGLAGAGEGRDAGRAAGRRAACRAATFARFLREGHTAATNKTSKEMHPASAAR